MTDLDHIKRSIARWAERKLQEVLAKRMSAMHASLSIMDDFAHPTGILVEKDLWISADYREWSIYLRRAGERTGFLVDERTLLHLQS